MSKQQSPSGMSSKLSQSRPLSRRGSMRSSNSGKQKSVKSSSSSSSESSLNQERVMQEAIQKASCLIELLTRQNSQYRQLINELEQKLVVQKQQCNNMKEEFDLFQESKEKKSFLEEEIELLKEENGRITSQNESLLIELEQNRISKEQLHTMRQFLAQSRQKNKQLHIKLAHLTAANSELTTTNSKLKKQYLSLQNENKFLLKQLQKHTEKQNIFSINITQKENEFNTKLSSLDKTKDAFARRTHELQQQNYHLIVSMEQIEKEKLDLQIIVEQSMQTLDALTVKLQTYRFLEEKIHQIYEKIKLQEKTTTNYSSQLYSLSEVTVNQKLYQIELVLNYRLQHVQGLVTQILGKVSKSQWKSTSGNLKDTQLVVHRLKDYMDELAVSTIDNPIIVNL